MGAGGGTSPSQKKLRAKDFCWQQGPREVERGFPPTRRLSRAHRTTWGEEERSFTVEKAGGHHLGQGPGRTSAVMSCVESMYLGYDVIEKALRP